MAWTSSSKAVPGLGAPRDSDASAVNVGVGGSPAHFAANGRGEVDTSNSGPVRGNKTGSQMVELGLSAGLGWGTSKPKHDLLDVNGDGLPDVVSRDGAQLMVALNLGYGFAAAEAWGAAVINDGASENGTIGATLGFNDGIYGFGGGLSLTKDKSLTRETLEDVNGDGLLDRVLPGGSAGMQVGLEHRQRLRRPGRLGRRPQRRLQGRHQRRAGRPGLGPRPAVLGQHRARRRRLLHGRDRRCAPQDAS